MWAPEIRKSGGGTGWWGEEEKEEEAEATLTIFNHRGSTGRIKGSSILKPP